MAKAKRLVAHILGVAEDDVRFEDGVFRAEESNRAFTWFELAACGRATRPARGIRQARACAVTMRCTTRSSPNAPRSARWKSIPKPAGRSGCGTRGRGRCRALHQSAHRARSDTWQGVGEALWKNVSSTSARGSRWPNPSMHYACRVPTTCPAIARRLSRCCRQPTRSARRPAAKAAPRRRWP